MTVNESSRIEPGRGATWQSPPPTRPRRWGRLLTSRRLAGTLLVLALAVLVGGPLAFGAAQPEDDTPPPGALPSNDMCGPDDPGRDLPPCSYPGQASKPLTSQPELTAPPPSSELEPYDPLDPLPTNMCIPVYPIACDDRDTPTAPSGEACDPDNDVGCLPNPTDKPDENSGGKRTKPKSAEPADECGITDIGACITEGIDALFRGIVTAALNPLLKLVSDTLLTTPTLEELPQVGPLWDSSWQILLASYTLLVLIGGLIVMGHETLQTHYTIKEIAPRLVVGFLAGFLSLWFADKAIALANGLSGALLGGGLDGDRAGKALRDMVMGALTGGGLWLLLMGLALAVMLVALLITYVIRVAITVILLIGAPLALMFHALPQTEGIARWWWRAFGAVLAIQVAQSLTLLAALRVFFDPSGFTPFGPKPSGLINLLVALALVYVLLRIPSWMLGAASIGGGGRTFLGSMVRGFLAYKAFGMLTNRTAAPAAGRSITAPQRPDASPAPSQSPTPPPPVRSRPGPDRTDRPRAQVSAELAPPIEDTLWGRGGSAHSSEGAHQRVSERAERQRSPGRAPARPAALPSLPEAVQRAHDGARRAWRPLTEVAPGAWRRAADGSSAVVAAPLESTPWGHGATRPVPTQARTTHQTHDWAQRMRARGEHRFAHEPPRPIVSKAARRDARQAHTPRQTPGTGGRR